MTSGSEARSPVGADTATRRELITPEPAEALAGLMDIELPSGEELPPLWHWIYLVERRPQGELGPDGHARTGIPAPPSPGRLRMFGGGRVTTHRPLRYDEPATKATRLVREVEKAGRSGPMTLTTVRSEIRQAGQLAISEEQDIVYRQTGSTVQPSGAATAPPQVDEAPPEGRLEMAVDPVVLFRFSALTYNAHRIHYDAGYTASEGYPGLVVHGPLQALLMGECLRRSGASLTGSTFSYRLVAPTFGEQRLTVTSYVVDGKRSARVQDGEGKTTATATLEPATAEPART
jgi:3-methylfumaryl-CoA hydratase